MSTHAVTVVEVGEVRPHPNAERLDIVAVGPWQVVVKRGEFVRGQRAVYVEPDYVVPTTRPEFAFLAKAGKDTHRLKAVRLRGELSFGLLLPLPPEISDAPVGTNVMETLGIARYEPPAGKAGTFADEMAHDRWPSTHAPKFDLENYNHFPSIITPGEHIVCTEKVHGANARYVYVDGEFFMGSRNRWVKQDGNHIWTRAAANNPNIEKWCRTYEGMVLYGEIYGAVQSLKYGLDKDVRFTGFAAVHHGVWLRQPVLFPSLADFDVPHVPIIYSGPFDIDRIKEIAEQDSVIAETPGHMMEGVVIVPSKERYHSLIGRVALKYISNRYWLSNA